MDAQQHLNLGLLREFAARGIEFAFPTRTLYMANPDNPASPGESPAAREAVAGA
jgi:hypothetical protein